MIVKSFLEEMVRSFLPMAGFMAAYLAAFYMIEHWNRLRYTVIHSPVDAMIPFMPAFVVPYLLWFPYVVFAVVFFLMVRRDSFERLCTTLSIGMAVFIAVSVFFPNIHLLRPEKRRK